MNPPRVFISYSHDSAEHKKWVLDFASTLVNRGVDAVLDQWDLKPGDDLPHFMETQLASVDYVLMICTEEYVQKANSGSGGVGYEKMIVTASMLSKIDNNKIIPIIRQHGTDIRPTFLQSKLYINFSKDSENEYNLDNLLRTLLNAPLYEKPKIGDNPFKPLEESSPNRISDGVKEVMKLIADCYQGEHTEYIWFSKIVNSTSMHRLTLDKYIKEAIDMGLINWFSKYSNDRIIILELGINYLETHDIIST